MKHAVAVLPLEAVVITRDMYETFEFMGLSFKNNIPVEIAIEESSKPGIMEPPTANESTNQISMKKRDLRSNTGPPRKIIRM